MTLRLEMLTNPAASQSKDRPQDHAKSPVTPGNHRVQTLLTVVACKLISVKTKVIGGSRRLWTLLQVLDVIGEY